MKKRGHIGPVLIIDCRLLTPDNQAALAEGIAKTA
jgi:hypothetical protein